MSAASTLPPSSSDATPPQSSRKGCWILGIGGGCLGLLLVCGGVIGLAAYGTMGLLKSSQAYTESLARARANADVQAALGDPIEDGSIVTGNVNFQNNDGEADLSYGISGPDGSGQVTVEATMTAGEWDYERMDVSIEGRAEPIDLLE